MSWLVGRGSRNGRSGWVAYREDDQRVEDPVFRLRREAQEFADEKNQPRRSGPSLTAAQRRDNGLELVQGLWLPAALVLRLDAECDSRGVPRTAVVREALETLLAQ